MCNQQQVVICVPMPGNQLIDERHEAFADILIAFSTCDVAVQLFVQQPIASRGDARPTPPAGFQTAAAARKSAAIARYTRQDLFRGR